MKKVTLLDLPMPSLYLFELELYGALLDNNLRACMHTIDPKHETVSLAPTDYLYENCALFDYNDRVVAIVNLLDCSILCMPFHIVASIP